MSIKNRKEPLPCSTINQKIQRHRHLTCSSANLMNKLVKDLIKSGLLPGRSQRQWMTSIQTKICLFSGYDKDAYHHDVAWMRDLIRQDELTLPRDRPENLALKL